MVVILVGSVLFVYRHGFPCSALTDDQLFLLPEQENAITPAAIINKSKSMVITTIVHLKNFSNICVYG